MVLSIYMIGKTTIYCSRCKSSDNPLMKHTLTKNKKAGTIIQYNYCRPCQAARQKKRYASNPKKYAQYIYKSMKKYPERQNARSLIHYHTKKGNITKPTNCEACGCAPKRIQAHHHDYSKPLDVAWLCSDCHAAKK